MASSERTTQTTAETAIASSSAPQASSQDSGAVSRGAGQRGERPEGFRNPSGASTPERQALMDGLRCDLLMNARYHASREAFLDTVHRVLMFLIIVLGAGAVTDLFNTPWIRGAFAASAVIFAALDLTADLSNRARTHSMMKRRYFELLADLADGLKTPTQIEASMHRCSAEEEPAFHALLAESWNAAQEMIYGNNADQYRIPWRHHLLKNIRRYGQAKYRVIQGSRPATA